MLRESYIDSKYSGWATVIKAVQSPFGVLALALLVLDGGLLAASAATDRISIWAPTVLLAVLLGGFFLVVWKKPYALYHPKDWPSAVTVHLVFPHNVSPIDVELNVERCTMVIRDVAGNRKHEGRPNLLFDHGGWNFELSRDVGIVLSDSVRLTLVEDNGRQWQVRPFPPYSKDATVVRSLDTH